MKSTMLKSIYPALVMISVIQLPLAHGKCSDHVGSKDFPSEITTRNGTKLKYSYQFEPEETYTIAWTKGSVTGGPIGPFFLQPSCKVPEPAEESEAFVLLEKGCGTFCWYFEVLGVAAEGRNTGTYERIERPLAFDVQRNLLAYYRDKDSIGVRNLRSGYEQVIATVYACESASGLCFRNVAFTSDSLTYTWNAGAGVASGEQLSHPLDDALLKQ